MAKKDKKTSSQRKQIPLRLTQQNYLVVKTFADATESSMNEVINNALTAFSSTSSFQETVTEYGQSLGGFIDSLNKKEEEDE